VVGASVLVTAVLVLVVASDGASSLAVPDDPEQAVRRAARSMPAVCAARRFMIPTPPATCGECRTHEKLLFASTEQRPLAGTPWTCPAKLLAKAVFFVGLPRFELGTPCSQSNPAVIS
jgi:hypothetical protein